MNNIPENILVVQIGKLGDLILTTPLLKELRSLYPNSKIHLLCRQRNYDTALQLDHVSEVLVYPDGPIKRLLFFARLRKLKIDLWIDTKREFSSTSKLLVKTARALNSLGYNTKEKIFDVSLEAYKQGDHATDINLSSIYYLRQDNTPLHHVPDLKISDEDTRAIDEYIKDDKSKRILINISAGDQIRYWDKKKWKSLINMLGNDGYSIYLINSKDDDHISKEIVSGTKPELKYMLLSLFEKFALIKRMDLLISPDTAFIHAASSFNIPTIGLYTNVEWNINRFAPLADKNKVIISDRPDSINSINEKEVYDAVTNLLNG